MATLSTVRTGCYLRFETYIGVIEDQGAHADKDQSEETNNQAPTSAVTVLSTITFQNSGFARPLTIT